MKAPISIKEKFSLFSDTWHPRIIAEANGQLVKIAHGNGELVWHQHENEDELFLVFEGLLTIQLRDQTIKLGPGEMFVVPRGIEHCPSAQPGTRFMMIEPASTAHTGTTQSSHSVPMESQPWI